MRRKFILFIILVLLFAILRTLLHVYSLGWNEDIEVLVVYGEKSYQVDAFKSVLEEEGIPHRLVDIKTLLSVDPKKLAQHKPAVIIPDGTLQHIHPSAVEWFKDYLSYGGSLLISQDAGIKNYAGAYLKSAIFSPLLGINYILYDKLRADSFSEGYIKIVDENLEITPGKIDKKQRLITGYVYGGLTYPYAKAEDNGFDGKTLAFVVDKEDSNEYKALVWKKYKEGYIFYSSLPLGHLKAYSDDMVLRSVLRYFLFKLVKIPHLMNTPKGRGGLVINWHVNANSDWISIPMMLEKGYIRNGLEYSFHITAGEFRDEPGDNLGFDACGKGKKYVEMIMPYGTIGSHGGWAHNWFSYGILDGRISKKDIYKYIEKNNKCLESITGYKIREYSAPNGVHSQPETTKILEKLGFVAYYYTGDSGSSPNRTFIGGEMVSSKVIAFPITPYEESASFYEMHKNGVSEEEVYKFLVSLTDFCIKTRQIRLFYSHPYDIPLYPNAFLRAVDYWESKENDGLLEVHSMSYFADFLLRFLKTEYSFRKNGDELVVRLKNPEGLEEIGIAIPNYYGKVLSFPKEVVFLTQDEHFYYFYVNENAKELELTFKFH
jgi:Polysaccharide deacetylase.